MARDGNGLFSRLYNWVNDRDASVPITASRMDAEFDGIATALTNSLAKNGETDPTANLPMATYKHTGVGATNSRTDYADTAAVQDGGLTYAVDTGAADAYVMSLAPAITAYVTGAEYAFKVVNASTGAATLNINGVGAKTIKKYHDQDIEAGDLEAGGVYVVRYDGTNMQLVSPVSGSTYSSDLTLSGNNTHSGTNTFQKTVYLKKGADVASAAELPILTDGNYFDVTGTETVTSIATTGKIGTVIKLHFDDVLTLTHHATDLILPGGANITTAAGDEAEFVEYASGDFRCTSYTRADGTSLVSDIVLGTPVASTSGTSIDFTSIPAGTKRITVNFKGVSTNGTSNLMAQIGDSGGIETSGYLGNAMQISSPTAPLNGAGFLLTGAMAASNVLHGRLTLELENESAFSWIGDGVLARSDGGNTHAFGGSKSLSAELDRVRITTAGGTDTFDAGEINITYE